MYELALHLNPMFTLREILHVFICICKGSILNLLCIILDTFNTLKTFTSPKEFQINLVQLHSLNLALTALSAGHIFGFISCWLAVSEITPILQKMLASVLATTGVQAHIRYHVIY